MGGFGLGVEMAAKMSFLDFFFCGDALGDGWSVKPEFMP
jgi:hypothetical protein